MNDSTKVANAVRILTEISEYGIAARGTRDSVDKAEPVEVPYILLWKAECILERLCND